MQPSLYWSPAEIKEGKKDFRSRVTGGTKGANVLLVDASCGGDLVMLHVRHLQPRYCLQVIIFSLHVAATSGVRCRGRRGGICCWRLFTLAPGRTGGHTPRWRGALSVTCEKQLSNLWSLGLLLRWTGFGPCRWFLGHYFTHGVHHFFARSYLRPWHLHDGLNSLVLA